MGESRYVQHAWNDWTRVCTKLYYCYYFCFIYWFRFRSFSSRRRSCCVYGGRCKTRVSASDLSSWGKHGEFLSSYFYSANFRSTRSNWFIRFYSICSSRNCIIIFVSNWYKNELATGAVRRKKRAALEAENAIVSTHIKFVIILLVFLTFVRSWYGAGIGNFYQFYLIEHYGLSIKNAQYFVFAFMIAGVLGTFFGGPLADRFGKKNIIVFSMLGSAPLALLLPHVSLVWVVPLFLCIGFISSSSFSVIVVYAQELVPGKVGMVSGLIVGLAFGLGALGAVVLGKLADIYSLQFIMLLCSCLPLIGLTSWLLPSDKKTIE
ncbi:Fosmidomycin resistance protein [Bacillus thuringiensis serovar israelensis ATCC 35646]|nr:Fosmidomycin resistance protein [Bacillus thuringiensis serovar israelensis ATCC 35646]